MQQKIGILGAGRVGSAIARVAIAAGYDVAIASSGPAADLELLAEIVTPGARAMDARGAAEHGDIVVVAVPLHKHTTVDAELLRGKVVIDTMNYWEPIDGLLPEFTEAAADGGAGTSAVVRGHFSGSALVKTLNHIGYHDIELEARPDAAAGDPARRALGIAGDDPEAVAAVASFIDGIGFDAVPTGPLASGVLFQPGSALFGARHTAPELRELADAHCAAQR